MERSDRLGYDLERVYNEAVLSRGRGAGIHNNSQLLITAIGQNYNGYKSPRFEACMRTPTRRCLTRSVDKKVCDSVGDVGAKVLVGACVSACVRA